MREGLRQNRHKMITGLRLCARMGWMGGCPMGMKWEWRDCVDDLLLLELGDGEMVALVAGYGLLLYIDFIETEIEIEID